MERKIGQPNMLGSQPIMFGRINKKGNSYALVGFGPISKKAVKINKDAKGEFITFDGKRIRL